MTPTEAIAELRDLVRCRCHEAYKGRGLHDPDCNCDSADAVNVLEAALAASPEVQAMLAEERARGMERAADSLWTAKDEEDWLYWGGGQLEDAGRSALLGAQHIIRAEAAALREVKP